MNTPHTLLQSLQQLLDYHDDRSPEPITLNEAVEHARQTLNDAEIRLRANFNRHLREALRQLNFEGIPTIVSEAITEIVKTNQAYRAQGNNFCHSHTFVDTNQVFIDAFQETYGEEFDPQNEFHQHLHHQGWVIVPDEA